MIDLSVFLFVSSWVIYFVTILFIVQILQYFPIVGKIDGARPT